MYELQALKLILFSFILYWSNKAWEFHIWSALGRRGARKT